MGFRRKQFTKYGINMAQISIIKYSDIITESHNHRFDSEFFRKDYLDIKFLLEKGSNKKLKDFEVKIYHPKEIKREYVKNDVLFLRAQNVRPLFLDLSNKVFISQEHAKKLKSNLISREDILITRTGANFGQCCLFNEERQVIASSHTFILKSGSINPYLLTIFLNTKYGREMINKGMYGGLQPEIAPFYLLNIPFPNFSDNIIKDIEKKFKKAHQKQTQSKQLYKEAEELLNKEIFGDDYCRDRSRPVPTNTFKITNTFETTKKEVERAKRFDAEYFQPKYKEIIKKIENYNGGFDVVGNIINWKKGIEVGTNAYTEDGKEFVRVSDFSIFGIEETSRKIAEEHFNEIKSDFQPHKGEILFTKDGTIGISYVLQKDVKGVLSSAFLRLTLKEKYQNFEKECLALIFNSILSKLQVEQLSGGAIIAHLKPSDFEKIRIPLIKPQIQKQIADKIQESHKLRKESKELLEEAKRKVEEEIEKK